MGKKSLPVVQETKSDDITSLEQAKITQLNQLQRLLEALMMPPAANLMKNPERPNMLKTENILGEEDKDLPEVG